MNIDLLARHREAIPQIAGWYYEQWQRDVPSDSPEKIAKRLEAYLCSDKLPLALVALVDNLVKGTAQLKYQEMSAYPQYEHWLGGVYVAPAPEYRSGGIGAQLVKASVLEAEQQGIRTLYLQTSRLDGGLYASLG